MCKAIKNGRLEPIRVFDVDNVERGEGQRTGGIASAEGQLTPILLPLPYIQILITQLSQSLKPLYLIK